MTLQERLAPGKYRLNVDDYARLGEAGVFGDAATELIGGEVIVMSPEWRPLMRVKDELAYRLRRALEDIGNTLFVGTGGSVAINEHEVPRPDIILTNAIDGDNAVPVQSVALLVEVSSTTLHIDLGEKAKLYAGAGVPEYWVADLNGRVIHQFWKPADGGYRERQELAFGRELGAAAIQGLTIDTPAL